MIPARLLNVSRPVTQRAIDDVLVRVTPQSGPARVMYMSRGRAALALARYPVGGTDKRFTVERLGPKPQGGDGQ